MEALGTELGWEVELKQGWNIINKDCTTHHSFITGDIVIVIRVDRFAKKNAESARKKI